MENDNRKISMVCSKIPLHLLPPDERDKYCYEHFNCSFDEFYKKLDEMDEQAEKHSE